jgi:hypothetical protein
MNIVYGINYIKKMILEVCFMRKRWILFCFILAMVVSNLYSEPWAYEGNDLSGHYKGDQFSIYYTMNADGWSCTSKDIGLGQTDNDAGLTWTGVTWDNEGGDGNGNNEGVRIDVQVTATGTWYYSLRCDSYYHDHSYSESGWNAMISSYDSDSFTVSTLNNPTLDSVVKDGTYSSTKINLTVTEDAQEHNVLIVRREGSAVAWTPTDGTAYSGGNDLGDNTVVINGSWDITDGDHDQVFLDEYYTLKPGTEYYYKTFSENNSYYSSGSSGSSATTDALPKPTAVSSTMLSDSKIKVEWTANGTYGDLMVIARKSSDLSGNPVNGTEYSVSDAIGDGSVIYKSNGSSYTYGSLDADSDYYFRVYTVDNTSDYYSANDGTTSTNETTHNGTTYHSVEFTGSVTDFSADENVYDEYYLTWDDTNLYAGEFNGIALGTNKFKIAIDKDPGTTNGYAPASWGGYDFSTNNDGTHNLEYIFEMSSTITNLYDSSDNFADPTDKSSYDKSIGTFAEIEIPWADLGGRPGSNWEIIMWFSNSSDDWMDTAWPSSNPTSGVFPLAVTELHTFSSAGTGITPNSSGGATPLPVTLSSFSAVFDGEVPVLQWVTASEINNAGWNVYRAETEDAASSMQVNPDLIAGQGTITSAYYYEFVDLYSYDYDKTYYYWLESVDYGTNTKNFGPISLFIPVPDDENNNSPEVPIPYGLHQNYPNPFNPSTEISFTLDYNSKASLAIYNLRGNKVRTLLTNKPVIESQCYYQVWDGKDEQGISCGTGIYIYRLETGRETLSRKMILVK